VPLKRQSSISATRLTHRNSRQFHTVKVAHPGTTTERTLTQTTFPSPLLAHRRADGLVHLIGLCLIVAAAGLLWYQSAGRVSTGLAWALVVYVLCALASNLASILYHFSRWHDRRTLLRRIDHAAIYPSISGTFTPFFVLANTTWTMALLWICWGLTCVAIWNKITNPTIKSRWSTASYLGLGAIGLSALPDLTGVPVETLWCIVGGALCYVCGTAFYARKSMPYRYAIWHAWVNAGGILMFIGIWIAFF
jgi:hemolysin III